MKAFDILKGWTYSTLSTFNLLSKDMQELSNERMEKCNTCNYNQNNADKKLPARCLMCSCYLPNKTFDKTNNCPINKW